MRRRGNLRAATNSLSLISSAGRGAASVDYNWLRALRRSIPDIHTKISASDISYLHLYFGWLSGIEPESEAPQAPVLTVTP